MFAMYLDDIGTNRVKTLQLLRKRCDFSYAEAKQMLNIQRPRILIGPEWKLLEIQKEFEAAGIGVSVEFFPANSEGASYIPGRLSDDGLHCRKCGTPLFFVTPGVTTREEIIHFAQASNLAHAEEIEKTGWIHPGIYCPNGCGYVMINHGDPMDDFTGDNSSA